MLSSSVALRTSECQELCSEDSVSTVKSVRMQSMLRRIGKSTPASQQPAMNPTFTFLERVNVPFCGEALRLANIGEFVEACRTMEAHIADVENCKDEETRIMWLMVLALIQCAAGAVEKSISTLQLALSRANNSNVSAKYAPMVMRRLAYVQMVNGRSDTASKLLDTCGAELEKLDCCRLERGMYHVVRFELGKRQVLSDSDPRSASTSEIGKPLAHLDKALRLFHSHYTELERNVYKEGALYASEVGLDAVRNLCAKMFYGQQSQATEGQLCFNWFLL